jgi:hypothetical protein
VPVSGGAILAPTFVQGLAARLGYAAETGTPPPNAANGEGGYGVLQPTPDKNDGVVRIALPAGFSYVLKSDRFGPPDTWNAVWDKASHL